MCFKAACVTNVNRLLGMNSSHCCRKAGFSIENKRFSCFTHLYRNRYNTLISG